jgi:hypothetical protein
MAYGKIKADAFIYDDGGSDTEITAATIASNSNKADTASPTFTGTVTLPGTVQVGGQATDVTIADNNANALEIKQGSNKYVTFDTTDSAERVEVDKLVVATDHITLNAQKELRLADSDSTHHIALKSPATVASNVTLTLPADDGNNGEFLQTNGSGVLDWAAVTQSTGNNGLVSTVADLNGLSAQTFGSIPSDAVRIEICYRNVRWTNSAHVIFRVGNGTNGIITSNYNTSTGYAGSGGAGAQRNSYFQINYNWDGGDSYNFDGVMTFLKMSDNYWAGWGNSYTNNNPDYQMWQIGTVDCLNTLDRVSFAVTAGTFMQGTADISYYTES